MATASAPLIPARLAWAADGTPYSAAYDDVYHSSDGGLGQARHVFLGGNGLSGENSRWRGRERFVIVETGFGLGLNFLATWQAWRTDMQRCGRLHFVSFEKHPFGAADLAQLHARWPELTDCSAALRQQWPSLLPGMHRLEFDAGRVVLTLCFGDAVELLPKLRARADAFYLDGFAPDRNADLWSPRIYSGLARLAVTGATLATWTVAGAVRKGLADVGFVIEKVPGFGGKREMTRGCFRVAREEISLPSQHHAIVVGAGLAGCSVAERLAIRGWHIDLVDRADGPAQGASGNHAGILRPLPSIDDNLLARLTRAGFLHMRRHLAALAEAGLPVRWDACGVLHQARDPQHETVQRDIVESLRLPEDYVRFIDRETAQALAHWPVTHGGWWFPSGGWIQPPSLCRANLARCGKRLTTHYRRTVTRCERQGDVWRIFDESGALIAAAPVLILANASGTSALLDAAGLQFPLPLRPARGQVTHLPANALASPDVVVCRLGYVTPIVDGIRSAGASFIAGDEGMDLRAADHQDNLARLELSLPGARAVMRLPDIDDLPGRAGVRSMTSDRLPLIGALPVANEAFTDPTRLDNIPRQPGLFAALGFGARGLVWAAMAAELLAAQIEGEPLPLEADLVAAVDPARFLLRRARRNRSETNPQPDTDQPG